VVQHLFHDPLPHITSQLLGGDVPDAATIEKVARLQLGQGCSEEFEGLVDLFSPLQRLLLEGITSLSAQDGMGIHALLR
jgi:hypothetical protein